jgi:hypothetical protein
VADFGKLNFSTALNPTSAFPLDARCYFESMEEAQAAAATAEPVGSTNTVYYYGQKVLVYENDAVAWYTIQPDGTLLAEGSGEVAETVSLLIDGVEHAIDNVSDPEATETEDEYSLEIN